MNWRDRLTNRVSVFRIGILVCLGIFASNLMVQTTCAETRKLKIYYLHTGEKATIAYKKNGSYIPAGLKKVNYFLRDWRRNEPTRMDPKLLDLVWEVYQKSGSRDYIHVISGYRSPATNNMLRKRGRGVAKKSQHTFGKALDFFLPDVKLAKLRKIGLIKQNGGVGYYPRSGSPFVHMDTGSVRHWPRMSRKELVRIFPNGKTLHIPTDGKPLPGYSQAVASYNARKSTSTRVASAKGNEKERKSFFARLASLGSDDESDRSSNNTPAPRKVKTKSGNVSDTATKNPVAGPEIPQKPDLPLIASIPVPQIAPRNINRLPVIDNNGNFAVARFNSQNDIWKLTTSTRSSNGTISDKILANARPSFDVAAVPGSNSVTRTQLAAQAQDISTGPRQPAKFNHTRFNNERTPSSNSQLALIDNNNLRNQLIAQATKQMRIQFMSPPRPEADVGSRFQTALLAPQIELVRSKNPVLTRSFPTVNNTGNKIESVTSNPNRFLASDSDISRVKSIPEQQSPGPHPRFLTVGLATSNNTIARDRASLEKLRKSIELQNRELYIEKATKTSRLHTEKSISQLILATIPTPSPRLRTIKQLSTQPFPADDQDAGNNEDSHIAIAAFSSSDNQDRNLTFPPVPEPLDELSLGWYQQKKTGRFILANKLAIDATNNIRAPAYGRAAIRQSPKTVLTAGFIPSGSIQNFSSFSGKAINFQTFTKFN